ncbi:MAG: prolipoprotein diacylglyceryl transferase [Nanoarchaeota archaeon]|nr:prolipoprotein diacylglyceryl transferase [Nanoarchaeota archaeon]MBU1104033.1 prolipoprotein diacylglyceryl transferase [Nanoarchaeota archaeon]
MLRISLHLGTLARITLPSQENKKETNRFKERARIFHILFWNLSYFSANPDKLFHIWEGGLSFHGGLLGVLGLSLKNRQQANSLRVVSRKRLRSEDQYMRQLQCLIELKHQ